MGVLDVKVMSFISIPSAGFVPFRLRAPAVLVPKSEALPVHNRAFSKDKLFLPSSIVDVNTNINPA